MMIEQYIEKCWEMPCSYQEGDTKLKNLDKSQILTIKTDTWPLQKHFSPGLEATKFVAVPSPHSETGQTPDLRVPGETRKYLKKDSDKPKTLHLNTFSICNNNGIHYILFIKASFKK